ncbi:MAG: hypothetical protein HUJ80_05330 [Firmicutes bacterium]|nr:hypothetical protein [Bacillota bacterium]
MTYEEIMELDYLPELEKKMAKLVRVHGENHPELHAVAENFRTVILPESGNAAKELAKARILHETDNLTLPADACLVYARVFELLGDLLARIE